MRRILRGLRPNASRDVTDELRFHLEMRTREFIEQGMSPEEARRAADAAFGDVSAIDAQLRAERESRERGRARTDRAHELAMDMRFALRTLRKNIGFTAATLATLALGLGAATAVFTVVNGVLLRPLPYPDPSRLAMIWMSSKQYGEMLPLSAGFYNDIAAPAADAQKLATTTAFRAWNYSISSGGEAEQVNGVRVTPSFFGVIGVRPRIGRPFTDVDAEVGAPHVVILSDGLWQSRFGSDPNIVGRTIEMSGDHFTVVGVMPPGFSFPRGAELPAGLSFGMRTELWTPMGFTARERTAYGTQNLAVAARLRPAVTLPQLQQAVSIPLRRWLAANAPKLDLHYQLADARQEAGEHVRRTLYFLLAAVALLLLIACANVTNLLIVRTARRGREFAVRAALGAGRRRIARQLVTENVILAAGGAVIALALSVWATRAMLGLVPGSMPRADDIGIDWRVSLTVTVLALLVGVVFGLAAAIQVAPGKLALALREDSARSIGGRRGSVGRRALVVAEVSLSLMLLIGAGLLTVSFVRLQHVTPGFDPARVLTANVVLPIPGAFDPLRDGPGWARFFAQLQDRISQLPGVEAAGGVSVLPLEDAAETGSSATVGEPPPIPGKAHTSEYYVVEGDYFRAMRIPMLQGRPFTSGDVATSEPVVIVNREYARMYLNGDAMGKQLNTFFDFSRSRQARTIVGVVDNVQSGALDSPPQPQTYVPESQMAYPGLQLVLRTRGDPMIALAALKREVKSIDPTLALAHPRSMQDVFDASLARRRFSMTLIGFFAACALALAVAGLYGVIALSVSNRRRELGVRMALGARPADILRLILSEGFGIAAVGVLFGLAGAYAGSRLVLSLLYEVSATSAPIYAAAATITVFVTLAATMMPAMRATRVDPTEAFRE
jgi:putative ABC transport system permease protein